MTRVSTIELDDPLARHQQPSNPLHDRALKVAEEFWNRQDPQKTRKVSLSRLKECILRTPDADGIPNGLVIKLLRAADKNEDEYLDYNEYVHFAELTAQNLDARGTVNRAALSVLARSHRTVEKRSYLEEYKCCPPALFMILASAVETGIFIYYIYDMGYPVRSDGPTPIYSPLIYHPSRRYEAWRYVSCALIHAGYSHLIMNLIMQLVLGLLLEVVHGWWRVGLVYLAGVLGGTLLQSVSTPKYFGAGASGRVYALSYAHLGNLLLNWSEMEFRWIQLVVSLVWTIVDVCIAIYSTYFAEEPSNVAYMAHLGGAVSGLLVGINTLRNLQTKSWERYCWWFSLFLYLALTVVFVTLNIALPVPEYFPASDYTPLQQIKEQYVALLSVHHEG